MVMVRHYDVSKYENAVIVSDFVQSIAENLLEIVGAENRQAVVCHCGEIVGGSCSGYSEHKSGGIAAGILFNSAGKA